jgi:hypothetical protein
MYFATWDKTLVKNSTPGKVHGAAMASEIYLGYDRGVNGCSFL